MLRENPQVRPNIYQVLREACAMQNREPPVKDVSIRGRPFAPAYDLLVPTRSTRANRKRTPTGATNLCPTPTGPSRRRLLAPSSPHNQLSTNR
jgi:AP2-associated kinase